MPRKENGLMILDLQKDQVLLSKLYEEYNKRLIVFAFAVIGILPCAYI